MNCRRGRTDGASHISAGLNPWIPSITGRRSPRVEAWFENPTASEAQVVASEPEDEYTVHDTPSSFDGYER
jgi:hypothetical protein